MEAQLAMAEVIVLKPVADRQFTVPHYIVLKLHNEDL